MSDGLGRPSGVSGNWWNFSDDSKDGYSKTIQGTVTSIVRQPAFWEGKPKLTKNGKQVDEIVISIDTGTEIKAVSTGSTWSILYNCLWRAIDSVDREGDPVDTLAWLVGKKIGIATHGGSKTERNGFIEKHLAWYTRDIHQKERAFYVKYLGADEKFQAQDKGMDRPKAQENDWSEEPADIPVAPEISVYDDEIPF